MKFATIFAVIFSWVFVATPLSATIIFVDDDNTMGPWDGSLTHPYQFIQDGIDAAVGGDTVIVNDGTYTGDGNRDLNFKGKAITLVSKNGAEVTIIDCEGSEEDKHRGFYFRNNEGPDSIVDGFTIRNGCFFFGGGINCKGSNPTITNCTITGNSSLEKGGGINCENNSNPAITNCTISRNSAVVEGGGIYCVNNGNPTISNCVISGNLAGGIACNTSSPTITNCTITRNSAIYGGGIYCDESSPTITNCILWGDSPDEIYLSNQGTATVIYSNIQGGTGEGWFGTGCIDADPMFVNPLAENYDITTSSRCIDSGTSDPPASTTDYYGIGRFDDPNTPNTGGGTIPYYDMGAFEYADTDEDGLPDWWEKRYYGSITAADPTVDEEPDGATNLEEYTNKSEPFNADPDDDGRNDGEEIADGSNPWHPDNAEKTYYVNDITGSDMYDGLAASYDGTHGPKLTIQEGIDAAITEWSYIVLVSDGTYTGDGNRDLDFGGMAITLQSENGSDVTIIDCEGNEEDRHRGFHFKNNEGPDSVLDGFTIRNGYIGRGGGIRCIHSSPTIANCTISNNSSHKGGGIICVDDSNPIIKNCAIAGNTASENLGNEEGYGGGIAYDNNSNPTITNCTITGNWSEHYGGGIYCDEGNANITNCTISENTAKDRGGGIYCLPYCSPTLTNCTISGNDGSGIFCSFKSSPTIINCRISGNDGRGIYCFSNNSPTIMNCTISGNGNGGGIHFGIDSSPTIMNCTISGNSSANDGGGIYFNMNSNPTIINCMISGNSADEYGGGIYFSGHSSLAITNCTMTGNSAGYSGGGIYCSIDCSSMITNSILWHNTPDEVFFWYEDHATVTYSNIRGGTGKSWFGEGCIDADPMFYNPLVGIYDLMVGSPCIDSGTSNPPAPDKDSRGEDRFDDPSTPNTGGGAVPYYDMGAFEYVDTDGDGLPDWWELKYFGSKTAADPTFDEEPDGATNLEEYLNKSDPFDADSDNDGREDGEEIADGTNPLYPDNVEKTFYVNCVTGSDLFDGLAASYDGTHGPKLTIQAGIDVALTGWSYTVLVSDGTYTGDGNRDLDFKGKALTLMSENGPDVTIIDCEGISYNKHLGFNFHLSEGPDSVVDGFTIRNGYADNGGGISCSDDSSPAISNCTIAGNTGVSNGGGIYIINSNPTITNCTIAGNLARYGDGGGIYCGDSSPTIINCIIADNKASDYGGGIYCFQNSSPTIINCTITDNLAIANGGGIYCQDSDPTITNCIFWEDSPNEISISNGIPTITFSSIQGGTGKEWFGEGCVDSDPMFFDPLADNYNLMNGSPCIDSGTSDPPAPAKDLHGIDRFEDPNTPNTGGGSLPYYDMGAIEYIDFDNDGLPDWWEFKYFGSKTIADPTVDEEPDGLTNLEEYTNKTDPFNADPDNDGRDDVEEITDGSNPWHYDNAERMYYVNNITGSDMYDGLAASYDGTHGPKRTIQAGIDAAATGWSYTVLVSDGTYTGDGNRDLSLRRKGIILVSQSGAENCIIDCENFARGFSIAWDKPVSVIDGFTIQNGYGGGIICGYSNPTITNCVIKNNSYEVRSSGGGIYCTGSSPTITNCTITDNSSDRYGSGIYCSSYSRPTIINCTITSNSSDYYGGGIHCTSQSNLIISDCTISENSSNGFGGGIYSEKNSSLTITDCTITGNSANGSCKYGGGIYCRESSLILSSCIIARNGAEMGGGIYCKQSSVTIADSTIKDNSVGRDGGGIYCNNSNMTLTGCLLEGNRTSSFDEGGALYLVGNDIIITNCTIIGNYAGYGAGIHGSATITNSIIWDNSINQIYHPGDSTFTYCDLQGGTGMPWFGEGCIDADPGFAVDGYWAGDTWVEGDYHLTAGSPCIDAGTNDTPELPLFDLDGLLRIWTGWLYHRVDMGVYEYGSETVGISNMRVLGTGDVELTWLCSEEGVTEFDVWYSDDEFSNSMTWYLLEGDVPSGGDETKYVDTTASSVGKRSYKVSY